MKDIRVDKQKLLEIMRGNRAKHEAVYKEALEGFRERVAKELKEMLDDVVSGKRIRTAVGLHRPVNQTKDYDRVIGMLELSSDTEIMLSELEYRQYCKDEWAWTETFKMANAAYVQSAAARAYTQTGDEEDE